MLSDRFVTNGNPTWAFRLPTHLGAGLASLVTIWGLHHRFQDGFPRMPAVQLNTGSLATRAHPALSSEILLILAGAALGGFVNGLSGFGTTLVALPFWLYAVSPVVAAQLGAAGGIVGHLQALPSIWPLVQWRKVQPYILAGLVGVPIGTTLLPMLDARFFKLTVGSVIILFCAFQLIMPNRQRMNHVGWIADAGVGFLGGFLGGLAGMSGPLPTMWASLRGLAKDEKRVLFLTFNGTILTAMIVASAIQGLLSWEFGRALLISIPASIIGAKLGTVAYHRLEAKRYDHVVLTLLLLCGISLLWGNL